MSKKHHQSLLTMLLLFIFFTLLPVRVSFNVMQSALLPPTQHEHEVVFPTTLTNHTYAKLLCESEKRLLIPPSLALQEATKYSGCIITSIFGKSPKYSDPVVNMTALQANYSSYAFLLFTNMPEIVTPGWHKILFFDRNLRRFITMSRFPKFMAWRISAIRRLCKTIFYYDGLYRPFGTSNDIDNVSSIIHHHPAGLSQIKHSHNLTKELDLIVGGRKDTKENIMKTKQWLVSQPDFSWDCELYRNDVFGKWSL